MRTNRQKLANLLCSSKHAFNFKAWLAQEKDDQSVKVPNLDEISALAILPLAVLVANGPADTDQLAIATDFDEATVDRYLEELCEFSFVKEGGKGYEATPAGERAFIETGKKMLFREKFELKARLSQVEDLLNHVSEL